MIYDQIVERSAVKDCLYIFQKLPSDRVVGGIKKNSLLIKEKIGII